MATELLPNFKVRSRNGRCLRNGFTGVDIQADDFIRSLFLADMRPVVKKHTFPGFFIRLQPEEHVYHCGARYWIPTHEK